MDKDIKKLLEPVQIGKIVVKNRMVMPPMNTNYSNDTGALTPQMKEYYIRRAKGGVGFMVVEAVTVSSDSRNHGVQPMLYDEKFIPAWANLTEKLHRYRTKVSIEIAHFGSEANIEPRMSSSDICRFEGAYVKPMTVDEIHAAEDQFARTIENAKIAGFDAVTLHGAHGYLIAEFLSPVYNKRTDSYGGSFENRMRFLVEIIRKTKKLVGPDFPIIVRYSADEFIAGGRTIEESKRIATVLEEEGVAAIDVSAAQPSGYFFTIPPHSLPGSEGFLVPFSREIKKVVKIPVIVASGIRDPFIAERILENGDADMVALGRTLIADPDFCSKAIKKDYDNIRQCLSCQHCMRTLDSGASLRCAVNPETGREYEFKELEPAQKAKRVAVIGGGPAGMEAARVSKLRGHEVTLFEKTGELGGSLIAGAIPPNKGKIRVLIEWYKKQLKDLEIPVVLNKEITMETAKPMDTDVLIVAAGALYNRRIPGSDGSNVITAIDALRNPNKVGNKVVIIGGGATGAETAEYLAGEKVELIFKGVDKIGGKLVYTTKAVSSKESREITIVEMLNEIGSDMDEFNRPIMQIKLKENGVKCLTCTKVKEITGKGVTVIDMCTREEKELRADTVILAGGLVPGTMNLEGGNIPEVYNIADSYKPGRIADAIYEAYYTARSI